MIASSLANHLWQSTLVAFVAWLVTLALRRDRAGVRYGVWLVASLKFLVPFAALTSLGTRAAWHPILAASSSLPYNAMLDTVGQPFSQPVMRAVAHQSITPLAVSAISGTLTSVLVGAWILGAAALLAIWIARWRRVRAVVRSSTRIESGRLFDTVRTLERAAGLTGRIAIVSSNSSLEPGVFGILRPTLVWPSRMHAHLSDEQIEAIIAHEVMHVRRRDNLAAVLHMCVQAAFWLHPLVWWIGARLVDERERACDEAVVRSGREPETYAEGILKTCQFYVESPLTCVAGVTGSDLKKRIEHIMKNDARSAMNVWKKGLLAATASAALIAPLVVGVLNVRPVLALGQNAVAGKAAFDVTSVKPNNSGSGRIMMLPAANGGWQASNVTLGILVRLAFQLQDNQIAGGPKWLFEDRFDVMGTGVAAGKDGPLFEKVKTMVVDRFHLVTHVEKRDLPIYELVLARRDGKLGENLTPSTADCSAPQGPAPGQRGFAVPGPGERPQCGFGIGPGSILVGGQTIAAFAQNLSRLVGRIVVDKTNLKGTYNVSLTYAPDPGINPAGRDLPPGGPPPAAPAASDAPSIFAAVQEQLGLKLESTTGPVEVLVIDSADKPTQD
jgi:bla regulator protein blaR1